MNLTQAERLSPTAAVARLAAVTNTRYSLIEPLGGGRTGATAIQDRSGNRYVLKWEHDPITQDLRRTGVALAEHLRHQARWPVPEQHTFHDRTTLFVVQEMLPGRPVTHYTDDIVDDLLALHQRRAGIAAPTDGAKEAADLIHTLTVGGTSYCRHDTLHTHDQRTRAVLDRVRAIGASLAPRDIDGNDIVHGDLHRGNLLQVNGTLSGIVDLDFARAGDSRFDLTTLALDSLVSATPPDVTRRLVHHGIDTVPEHRRHGFLAHLLLRFVDWSIRTDETDETEAWVTIAERLLPKRAGRLPHSE